MDWSKLDKPYSTLENNPLAGRDLLRLLDLSPEELHGILSTSLAQKQAWKAGERSKPYADAAVAIIMEKPSLRTRVSFELGAKRLGAFTTVLSGKDSAFSRGESVKDTVMVLERFVDVIVIRTFEQKKVEEVAEYAGIPVINALSDSFHPCQGLGDLLTIYEHLGRLTDFKLAYVGDGNNIAHTFLESAALIGFELVIATPVGYEPNAKIVEECRAVSACGGANIHLTHDPKVALTEADVVVTDTWASMGDEDEHAERVKVFEPYRIDAAALALAKPGAIFEHCLPAHRGEEVTDEVMDGPASVIYDEAENRLHVQKALMSLVMASKK
ncbi:MAG: ornithine carbamoyltransferase [Coriobacteriia bacterium]|nr:ornithine carbamoyltransferase [Coriobacteriia bacterium]MCL2750947.1 ornithine carbamoyltransferase [Coriobacteriia bacterium]